MSDLRTAPAAILFTHFGKEWIRGSERALLDLLTHIDRRRFQPVVWCNAETLASEVRALEIPVHVSKFSILLDWVPPRYDIVRYAALVREGRRLVRQYNIRLLHSNSAAPTQWLLPVARSVGLPLLSHLLAPYVERERFTLGLHQATLVVGVTSGCIEGLLKDGLPASRTMTIHCGVDLTAWRGWDQRGLRASLGIGPEEIVITQVGSLIHRKGHDVLLRAFSEVRSQRPQCRLLIVGDGPDRPAIEALSRELDLGASVHFLGFVDPPPGVIFRDATDIAVSPSRAEGFGLTVIEAGAAGRAVVATSTTGMTEIIADEESGLIVPIEDPRRLAQALLQLVDDPALRQRLGDALNQVVQERFVISRYVANFESAYERLLAIPKKDLGWRSGWWSGQFTMYGRWVAATVTKRMAWLIRGS